jgi:hypothetical protein
VIFQFNDPENVDSIIKLFVRSGSCSNSVLWTVERSGNYCITVFPVWVENGIADSLISHAEELFVGGTESTSSSPKQEHVFPRGKLNQHMSRSIII